MASLDWIFLSVLVVSLVLGVWRGLVYEVLSVLGWIAAFVVAQWLAPDVAAWLPMGPAADSLRYAAGFVLVFIVVAFLGGLSAWGLKTLVDAVGMRPVDRTLGGAFGLVRGVVLLLAAAVVMNMTALNGSVWWMESRGAGVLSAALKGLKPVLPAEFGQYLPG
ncbi:MAG: CvpA family protein [Burkholderiaceae bacterium]|nr:CvpA family protein [Burkholderiaceae bacterium]